MPTLSISATRIGRSRSRPAKLVRCIPALAALIAVAILCAAPVQAAPLLAERRADGPVERLVARMEARNPFFRVMFQDHPAERRGFIGALEAARRNGGVRAMQLMAVRYGAHMGRKYFPYYIARTSDDAARGYVRFVADTLTFLRLGSHDDCYAFLAGSARERARVLALLNAEERRRMLNVLAAVVVGSRSARSIKDGPNAYRRPLQAVIQRVTDRLGRDNMVRWRPGLVGDDRAKACDFALAFYEEILKRPAREGALVARGVLGG